MGRSRHEEPPVEEVVEAPADAAPDAPATAEDELYAWADENGHPRDVGILRSYAPHELLAAYDEAVAEATAEAGPDPVEEAPAEDAPAEEAPAEEPSEG